MPVVPIVQQKFNWVVFFPLPPLQMGDDLATHDSNSFFPRFRTVGDFQLELQKLGSHWLNSGGSDFVRKFVQPLPQWLFLVPLKGGIGSIVHPPIGSIIYHLYTTYIPLIVLAFVWGLYNP